MNYIQNIYKRVNANVSKDRSQDGSHLANGSVVVSLELFLCDPGDALAIEPSAVAHLTLLVVVDADAGLLTIQPLALVLTTIGPDEDADTLLLVVDILTLVLSPVGPGEGALAVHLVHLPAALILAAVSPLVGAVTVDVVVLEVSTVGALISPEELTVAILLSIFVLTLIPSTIGPVLLSPTVLLVIDPVALILSAVSVGVLAKAMSLIVLPVAIVDVSISMDQSSTPIGLITLPVALINRAVAPDLHTATMALSGVHVPLAGVVSTVLENLGGSLLKAATIVSVLALLHAVLELRQLLADHLNVLPLLLQLLGIHFDLNHASVHETGRGLEAVDALDSLAGSEATDHGLHLHDEVERQFVECTLLSVGQVGAAHLSQVCVVFLREIVSATISHIII